MNQTENQVQSSVGTSQLDANGDGPQLESSDAIAQSNPRNLRLREHTIRYNETYEPDEASLSANSLETDEDFNYGENDIDFVLKESTSNKALSNSKNNKNRSRNSGLDALNFQFSDEMSLFKEIGTYWYTSAERTRTWDRIFASVYNEPVVTWDREGRMFVHMFDAHERQMFLDAVMRFGLPNPGIVPLADWLPEKLQKKDPLYVFAYLKLFMKHLYLDPVVGDDSIRFWSDGLPKEGVSGTAVLSRIAMIALIRQKVIEFEDSNETASVNSSLNTHFQFEIHDGELTLLHSVWKSDWVKIEQILQGNPTLSIDEMSAVVSHNWHRRHDYWLLAGILIHGYGNFNEIVSDHRFVMLVQGLKGIGSSLHYSEESVQLLNDSLSYLIHRLRMLEQSLLVEQSLFNIVWAACSDGKSNPGTPETGPPGELSKDEEIHLAQAKKLLVSLSSKLFSLGPRKQITLPTEPNAATRTRKAVHELQDVLEDIHADLQYLPAIVWCTEEQDPNEIKKNDDFRSSETEPNTIILEDD